MTIVTRFRRTGQTQGPAAVAAAVIELAILGVLLVFLGIAAGKLFVVLERVGVPFWKGASLGLLFVAAAVFTARRFLVRLRHLRRG